MELRTVLPAQELSVFSVKLRLNRAALCNNNNNKKKLKKNPIKLLTHLICSNEMFELVRLQLSEL